MTTDIESLVKRLELLESKARQYGWLTEPRTVEFDAIVRAYSDELTGGSWTVEDDELRHLEGKRVKVVVTSIEND